MNEAQVGGYVLAAAVLVVIAAAVGFIASARGRSGFGFFLLSLAATPVIGLAVALIMGRSLEAELERGLNYGELKRCPRCDEAVRAKATVCRFCGAELAGVEPHAPARVASGG